MATINGTGNNDTLQGTNEPDTINGLGGNDLIIGYLNNDVLDGGDGNDVIHASDGDDTVRGGTGDDILYGYHGADSLDGGAGDDHVFVGYPTIDVGLPGGDSGPDRADGGAGFDVIEITWFNVGVNGQLVPVILDFGTGNFTVHAGGSDWESVQNFEALVYYGNDGGDSITGSNNDDIVQLGYGDDVMRARGGADYIIDFGGKLDIDGGTGIDALELPYLFRYTQGITLLLQDGADAIVGGALAGSTVRGIEQLFWDFNSGTSFADHFRGGIYADEIHGGAGNDTLEGSAGDDTLDGGKGDDSIDGGDGNDHLEGGSFLSADGFEGADTINGGNGNDSIGGGNLGGTLTGGAGDDGIGAVGGAYLMDGGEGNDTLGGGGKSHYIGGIGNDVIAPHSDPNDIAGTSDIVDGGEGNDTVDIVRSAGVEGIGNTVVSYQVIDLLTPANNTLYAAGHTFISIENIKGGVYGPNDLRGNNGPNRLDGGIGQINRLDGRGGNDTLTGDVRTDTLIGGDGNDTLYGKQGNDSLEGGNGNDYLSGDDSIEGSLGYGVDDTLSGGAGTDTLVGGVGSDTYVNPAGDTIIEISDPSHINRDVVVSNATFSLAALPDIENITLTGNAQADGTGNAAGNVLTGNAGNNRLTGAGGDDTLTGGGGTDTLAGGTQNDTYVNPAGDIVAEGVNAGTDTVQSDATVTLTANVERLFLTGSAAADGRGNDLANQLTGNAGANQLVGFAGHDTLAGGAGADTLDGGVGADLLRGGTQRDKLVPGNDGDVDVLVFASVNDSTGVTRDVISAIDFNEDKIDLPGTVTGIAAAITGTLSTASFNADLVAAVTAARLPAGQAVLFDPNAGNLNQPGMTYLIVDANGIAGYQANADWVFQLEARNGVIDPADFI
ncbi:MAG: hypothetical protein IT548_19530 [Alphaproteobacteria bacterium]|nr:hypothetical protein [Alphaproteobacteria bacterium]